MHNPFHSILISLDNSWQVQTWYEYKSDYKYRPDMSTDCHAEDPGPLQQKFEDSLARGVIGPGQL